MLLLKDGVTFACIAPAGFRILAALEHISRVVLKHPLVITAGTNGAHLPGSKHYDGSAYDIRCKDLDGPLKQALVEALKMELGPQFTILLEAPASPNEHVHCQLRKFTEYHE